MNSVLKLFFLKHSCHTYPFLIQTLLLALYLFNNQISKLASPYIKCALIRVLPFLSYATSYCYSIQNAILSIPIPK